MTQGSLLGKNEGNAATSTSIYHSDDNEDDHDDLNYDDDVDNGGYDDHDDYSVIEEASRISPVQENTSDDFQMAHTRIIPQLAHHTWIICQPSCQKFSILLKFSKKIWFLFKM